MHLQGGLGLANANEKYGGDNPNESNSFEGLGTIMFDAFNIGDLSFNTRITAFPGLSQKGRVRLNGDTSLKLDLPLDFYIKASVTYDFDNRPQQGVDKLDYVFQTSIGWEWK